MERRPAYKTGSPFLVETGQYQGYDWRMAIEEVDAAFIAKFGRPAKHVTVGGTGWVAGPIPGHVNYYDPPAGDGQDEQP